MNARKDYQREMKSHNMSAGMDMQMTFNSKLPLSLLFEEIELQNSKGIFRYSCFFNLTFSSFEKDCKTFFVNSN